MLSSRTKTQQQKTPQRDLDQTEAVNPLSGAKVLSFDPARNRTTTNDIKSDQLLERILERDNLFKALDRVERNKGAPGIDQLTVEQ